MYLSFRFSDVWCRITVFTFLHSEFNHFASTIVNSIFREAKEDLPDGIYICLKTDSSMFNLWRLLTLMKTIEELITELLFADCALLAHREEAPQHIINRLS